MHDKSEMHTKLWLATAQRNIKFMKLERDDNIKMDLE